MPKVRNPVATCWTCPYWKKINMINPITGNCLLHGPVLGGTSEHAYTTFPVMDPANWCGEHPEFFMEVEDEGLC